MFHQAFIVGFDLLGGKPGRRLPAVMIGQMAFHALDMLNAPTPLLPHGAVCFEHDPAEGAGTIPRLIVFVAFSRPCLSPAIARLWAGVVGIFLHDGRYGGGGSLYKGFRGAMLSMTKRPLPPTRSKPLLRDDGGALQSRPIRKRNKAQPALQFDPMPDRVEPALALLKHKPPAGDQWGYEIKWDGYRIHVHIAPGSVQVLTKGGYDWSHRFPAIVEAARALGPASMILDGEAVMFDEQGRSDFNLLQGSLGAVGRRQGKEVSPAVMMAFDLLYLDGHDLRRVEYRTRRHLLEDALSGHDDGAIRLSEEIDADPVALLEHACRLGLEGIVGKDRESPYRSGRSGDWIKLKCVQSEGFFVVGYEPSIGGRGGFSSILLAAYDGDDLRYVGSVGTGFKERAARDLRGLMDKLTWKRKQPPVAYGGKRNVVWVQPALIAEIEFRAWTTDRKLRHAAYKGLREHQDNADVFRLDDGD